LGQYFLASPNFESECLKIAKYDKTVDFNQGLDARLYTDEKAKLLSKIRLNPIRLAFDDTNMKNTSPSNKNCKKIFIAGSLCLCFI